MLKLFAFLSRRDIVRAGFLCCVSAASLAAIASPREAQAESCVPVSSSSLPGLVAWWPGDGNTSDIIGSPPKNGALAGSVTYDPAGKVLQAFSFTGSGRVSLASAPTSTAFTIDAWVKVNSAADLSGYKTIYADDTRGLWLLAGKINWWAPGGNKIIGATAITPGGWHHVALTYSGNVFSAYLNGLPDGTASSSGQLLPALSGIGIGGHNYPPEHFKGLIDEVEVFNRALSQTEILSIVAAGSAGKCKPGAATGYDIQLVKQSGGYAFAGVHHTNYTISLVNKGAPIVCPARIDVADSLPAGWTAIGGMGGQNNVNNILWSMIPGPSPNVVGPATIALTASCSAPTTIPTGGTYGEFVLTTVPTASPVPPNCAAATALAVGGTPVTETSTTNNSACN